MSSTAIAAQHGHVRVATAQGSTISITGATKANPCVLTATNTFSGGEIIQVDAVAGMVELNGRAYVVASATGSTVTLAGIDSTSYTTYTSGGTITPQTMTEVNNLKTWDLQPDKPKEIDVTNMASVGKEFRVGLQGSWTMKCDYDIDPTDAGQIQIAKLRGLGTAAVYTITLANGKVAAGVGYALSASASGNPDDVVKGVLEVRGTGAMSWFA